MQEQAETEVPDYPRNLCVHEVLEEALRRTPGAIAVEFEGQTLTYAELHRRANQLAQLLRKSGVRREVMVGVCMERSLEMVVALLGVLKAGGAYVPLDPSYGSGRIQYVLDEARVPVLITQEAVSRALPPTSAKAIFLDPSWKALAGQSGEPVASDAGASNLAYVIYTSGSTGKPKGVQLEHRSVLNLLYSMRREPGLRAEDVLVAVTTLSFDMAVLEMFLPLLVGAKLVVASRQATIGVPLMRLLERSRATVLQATPVTWRLLFESGWQGNPKLKVLTGGEALSPELARRLASCCGEVWNLYGPTETTIYSSLYRVKGRDERRVPIGRPIANTTLYILDAGRRPVPAGAEGELYIGGDGLARGYFERPELTAEKFVPDPFHSLPDARMYRTGDLARCNPEGGVEFLGRLDHQVKIRGFRIELGEVETVLEQHPAVRQAVAVARDGDSSDPYLAAYFVPAADAKCSISELRRHLRSQLPDYMIPSAFVALTEFPLTPNAKVDRKALPAPSPTDYRTDREYIAPRNDVERRLTALWEEALGVGRIGVTDNFFELGGRSLLAARLFMKISHEFGKELPLSILVHASTIETLAKELEPDSKDARYPTLVAMQAGGSKPPFFCVHGGAGSTLFLKLLAEKLGPDQPFYGIEPDGLDGRPFRYVTVEQMAAFYLSEIRKLRPSGPYYFAGYCFGGLVAVEMAQQLVRQGEAPAAVVLFTAPLRFNRRVTTAAPRPQVSKPVASKVARLISSPISTVSWIALKMGRRVKTACAPMGYRLLFALGLKVPQAMRTLYVARTLGAAEHAYTPKPYPGRLTLLSGSDDPQFGANRGWDGLAAGFDHRIIGQVGFQARRDLFDEPLVADTARELAACLEAATSAAPAPVR